MRTAVAAIALCVAAVPALADTVVLKNGRSFDGVVADDQIPGEVRIQIPGGEVRIPASRVVRIDHGGTAYRDYLDRRAALGAQASAADWLALARWARSRSLDGAAREAALVAAAKNPHEPGLAELLGGLDYVLDTATSSYVSFDESMARQGKVFYQGVWMTSSEQGNRLDAERRAQEERASLAAATASRYQAPAASQDQPYDDGLAVQGIPLGYAWYGSPAYGRAGSGVQRARGFWEASGGFHSPWGGGGVPCGTCRATPQRPAPRPSTQAPAQRPLPDQRGALGQYRPGT